MTDILAYSSVDTILGCAVCFGDPNSLYTKGLNWGIISLLAVLVFVLGGCAAFFLQVKNRMKKFSKFSKT